MDKLISAALVVLIAIALGCSREEKEEEILEMYGGLIRGKDVRKLVEYSGKIENEVQEIRYCDGVIMRFFTEGKEELILNVALEKCFPEKEKWELYEKNLVQRMSESGRETLGEIGDHAWFYQDPNGYNQIIFLLDSKQVLVQVEGLSEGGRDPDIFVDRKDLVKVARLVEKRL